MILERRLANAEDGWSIVKDGESQETGELGWLDDDGNSRIFISLSNQRAIRSGM